MTLEEWSLVVGVVLSVGLSVGSWMFMVHGKLAVIATRIIDLCAKLEDTRDEHRRLWEITRGHQSRLDTHDVQLTHIAERLRGD